MGQVIDFQLQSRTARSTRTSHGVGPAEILFFTGVRYERREPEGAAIASPKAQAPRVPRGSSTGN